MRGAPAPPRAKIHFREEASDRSRVRSIGFTVARQEDALFSLRSQCVSDHGGNGAQEEERAGDQQEGPHVKRLQARVEGMSDGAIWPVPDEAMPNDEARAKVEGRTQRERGPYDQSVTADEKPTPHAGEEEVPGERLKKRPRGIRRIAEGTEEPSGISEERERESEAWDGRRSDDLIRSSPLRPSKKSPCGEPEEDLYARARGEDRSDHGRRLRRGEGMRPARRPEDAERAGTVLAHEHPVVPPQLKQR